MSFFDTKSFFVSRRVCKTWKDYINIKIININNLNKELTCYGKHTMIKVLNLFQNEEETKINILLKVANMNLSGIQSFNYINFNVSIMENLTIHDKLQDPLSFTSCALIVGKDLNILTPRSISLPSRNLKVGRNCKMKGCHLFQFPCGVIDIKGNFEVEQLNLDAFHSSMNLNVGKNLKIKKCYEKTFSFNSLNVGENVYIEDLPLLKYFSALNANICGNIYIKNCPFLKLDSLHKTLKEKIIIK